MGRPRRRARLLVAAGAAVVLGALLATFLATSPAPPATKGHGRGAATKVTALVGEQSLRAGHLTVPVSLTGTVGGTPIEIAPSITSLVTGVEVHVGERVHPGQAVATLEDSQGLAAKLAQADAQLAQAKSALAAATAAPAALALRTDEQALATARSTLSTDEKQLRADQALGCPGAPAAASGSGSGSGSTGASTLSGNVEPVTRPAASTDTTTSLVTTTTAPRTTAPAVATTPAGGLSTTGASLGGLVDPGGLDTTYTFDYGTTTAYGSSTPSADAGSGLGSTPVTATVGGLAPGTTYDYRIVATNALGTVDGANATFTTEAPPVAATGTGTGATATSVTLSATVDPGGVDTTYTFDYGTTPSLAERTPTADAGSGTAPVTVTATVTGLRADATYLFRVVATSALGSSTGVTKTFATEQRTCGADQSQLSIDRAAVDKAQLAVAQQQSTAGVAADEAAVAAAQDGVSAAAQAAGALTVTAPAAGTIGELSTSVGSAVSAGSPVAQLVPSGSEVTATASPTQLLALRGQLSAPARVAVAVPGGATSTSARLASIAPEATPSSGATEVTLTCSTALPPGEPVTATISVTEPTGLLAPASAVVYQSGHAGLYRLTGAVSPAALGLSLPASLPKDLLVAHASFVPVELVATTADTAELAVGSGLAAGDEVVTSGQTALTGATTVGVLPSSASGAAPSQPSSSPPASSQPGSSTTAPRSSGARTLEVTVVALHGDRLTVSTPVGDRTVTVPPSLSVKDHGTTLPVSRLRAGDVLEVSFSKSGGKRHLAGATLVSGP